MAAFLLSWNPEKYQWVSLRKDIVRARRRGFLTGRWSCGNRTDLPKGSEFFLLRLGPALKGLVGRGVTASEPYEDKHWDSEKRRQKIKALYVKVRFAELSEAPVISWDELQQRPLSRFKWSSFTSGVALPEVIVEELDRRWTASKESADSLRPKHGKPNHDGRNRARAPLVYSDSMSMRRDPEAARAVFDLIFDEVTPECRRRWESFLADSIEYAASKYSDRWVVVLEPSNVRATVGMVRCLHITNAKDEVVLVSRIDAPRGTRWSGGQYDYAPGCEEAMVARAAGPKLLSGFRAAHFLAIDACGAAHAGNHQRRQTHSPGVLRYLEQVLGRMLPNPSYEGKVSNHAARATMDWVEDASIESHPFANELAEELSILRDAGLSPTEKKALIVARRGQGLFRQKVLCAEPRCRVTRVDDPNYLIASHIKPWSESSNVERLSENNGLMSAPHVGYLFDKGLISFTDIGDILVSQDCPPEVLSAWGISRNINVGPFEIMQRPFLTYHRAYCFKA
jgi:hypothetical protein